MVKRPCRIRGWGLLPWGLPGWYQVGAFLGTHGASTGLTHQQPPNLHGSSIGCLPGAGTGWGTRKPPHCLPKSNLCPCLDRKKALTGFGSVANANKVCVLTQKPILSQKALLLQKKSSVLSEYCLCCEFLKIHPESQLISLF